MASASIKRAWLEEAFDAAAAKENFTLRKELRLRESAALKASAGGNLKAVSANGRSSVFQDGNQQTEVVCTWRELIDLHDSCMAALIEEGAEAPTDTEVKDAMLASPELAPGGIREARGDFTHLRIA